MTRYLSTVEDAVQLVRTAMENIDRLQGAVLTHQMKAVLIREMLDLWIRERGGRWEKIEGRPGERPHEYLIGEPELPFTQMAAFNGLQHFVIKFNEPVAQPLPEPFCSSGAERLSEQEMLDIINSPPTEEL
jgi:FlaA1/EpsC-like NDP-sugar epimerase